MTTYTANEFGTRLLKDLGLIGAEETPSAADMAWATETASSEIMALSALNLPIWNGSHLAIPQEYLTTLSRRVGIAMAASFGLASPAEAMAAMREAERSLTLMAAPKLRAAALKTDTISSRGTFNYATGE